MVYAVLVLEDSDPGDSQKTTRRSRNSGPERPNEMSDSIELRQSSHSYVEDECRSALIHRLVDQSIYGVGSVPSGSHPRFRKAIREPFKSIGAPGYAFQSSYSRGKRAFGFAEDMHNSHTMASTEGQGRCPSVVSRPSESSCRQWLSFIGQYLSSGRKSSHHGGARKITSRTDYQIRF